MGSESTRKRFIVEEIITWGLGPELLGTRRKSRDKTLRTETPSGY